MLKKRVMQVRRAKLIKGLVAGQTVKEAAVAAGYPGQPETARCEASKDLRKPEVQRALADALDRAGASIDSAARVIAAAQQAMDTKFFQHEGRVLDTRDVVDHVTRLRAAELNLKARRLLGGDEQAAGPINIAAIIAIVRKSAAERGLDL